VGTGTSPDVLVDPAGTVHVVWASGSDLESCAIPHGGHACGPTATLPPAPGADARPHLLRRASDGALFVVDGRFADAFPDDGKKVFAWSSPACGTALVRPTCFA